MSFERRLQLQYFFKDKHQRQDESKAFETNSEWWPPKLNPKITSFCNNIKSLIIKHEQEHKTNNNLTTQERKVLRQLKNNNSIVIKKVDKSAGIVIMDSTDYENKIVEMLNEEQTYTPILYENTVEIKDQADKHFQALFDHEYINKKQLKNLTDFTPRCPIFYGIPKIHKPQCPLRPIVSQINGPTCKISQYIDVILTTAEKNIPYLLKDTTAFLQLIEEHKNTYTNSILVTLDVVSLYTNIPQVEGAEFVMEHYIHTLPLYDQKLPPIPPETLKEFLLFTLQNTIFEFNNTYYTQNYGTTMGANFSVKFANIYMHKLLSNMIEKCESNIPPFLARLVDDIFFFWPYSEDTLHKFFTYLNSYHKTIKFELTYSYHNINFLDTIVYRNKDTNTLHTKLYIKPTHKNQYLHFSSEHPFHVKKAIPYAQALRYRRIIDKNDVLQTELYNLKLKFKNRGYSNSLLEKEISRVQDVNREDTLRYKISPNIQVLEETHTTPFLPLIINYNNSHVKQPTLRSQILKLWNEFLQSNVNINETFTNTTPFVVYKRGTSLQNILVSAKYIKSRNTFLDTQDKLLVEALVALQEPDDSFIENIPKYRTKKCKHPLCGCCDLILESNHFSSTKNNKKYPIKTNMNCNSSNLIYLITCKICHLQYVGETKRKLKDRLNDHLSNIKTNKITTISLHFKNLNHSIEHLQIIPIELINNDDKNIRLTKEKYWIQTLKTAYPYGLNNYPLDK